MASGADYGLLGLPLAASAFASMLNSPLTTIFASIVSVAIAVAAVTAIQAVGGFQIFGSGIDIKDWSIKLVFIMTFLTAFYASNLLGGLNLLASLPSIMGFPLGLVIFGVLTTMYVFGMFGLASNR